MDYIRVISKHRLGAEFEMDYALERLESGYDLVEIKSSNLKLFTKAGNPSSHLVHAEQQVIDWLSWVDNNGSYAKQSLPGLIFPKGYVVIGRRSDLSPSDKDRLLHRNSIWDGKIVVLTYDDLLGRARAVERNLLKLAYNEECQSDK